MNKVQEIKNNLNAIYKKLSIYRLLTLYNLSDENIECFDALCEFVTNITSLINKKELSEEETNILLNDYVTLKDLISEFRDSVYHKFSLTSLSFIESQPMDVVNKYYDYKKALKKKTSKDILLKYMKSLLDKINHIEVKKQLNELIDNIFITEDDIDKIYGIFRKYGKDVDNTFLNDSEYLGFMYFDYLVSNIICFTC